MTRGIPTFLLVLLNLLRGYSVVLLSHERGGSLSGNSAVDAQEGQATAWMPVSHLRSSQNDLVIKRSRSVIERLNYEES